MCAGIIGAIGRHIIRHSIDSKGERFLTVWKLSLDHAGSSVYRFGMAQRKETPTPPPPEPPPQGPAGY